jgi:anti-sigma factor RsiW
MQQDFTQQDVILYIYNELDPERRKAVELAIATTPELLVFFQETILMVHQLDQIADEPASTVIRILNEESRSNSLEIH